MIRFSLVCDQGHEFESWFRDSAAYDDQAERGLLSCAHCASTKIGKAIMAPQVARKDRENRDGENGVRENLPALPQPVALTSPDEQALRAKVRELHAMLTAKSDYVGDKFAAEARKMHEGESEHRTIHGEATGEDVRTLLEDGIDILPLPMLPDDRN
ncbi:hypothetical protein BA190_32810 [Labrys sp. WJW]|uniref:DUF1178 family protein n=1 Tax=Labrys sp. WJW TaxID=1737983 RepID=UPI00082D1ED5|nr:DUF1178 family protein [Labrys sp. WJW]OCC00667.1 hypothetical protein BA190_32810 [Labrys sp. WJW]